MNWNIPLEHFSIIFPLGLPLEKDHPMSNPKPRRTFSVYGLILVADTRRVCRPFLAKVAMRGILLYLIPPV